ncbi:MAG: polysaccharide deacetylase family protein [Nitrosopumilaceae archaeon]
MNIVSAGIISTTLVVFASFMTFGLIFFEPTPSRPILLSFDIVEDYNLPDWCIDLSKTLEKNNVKAAIFVTGKIAEKYPQCVQSFSDNIDIGSQTYNYVNLNSILDYTIQLEEVKLGKNVVDKIGNLDSKLFKAPYGNTDENIYSILSRSGILADFSYSNQYNKFSENQFLKYNITSYNGAFHNAGFFKNLKFDAEPIMINYNNETPVDEIDDLISKLKSDEIRFVSASDLTETELTRRINVEVNV